VETGSTKTFKTGAVADAGSNFFFSDSGLRFQERDGRLRRKTLDAAPVVVEGG